MHETVVGVAATAETQPSEPPAAVRAWREAAEDALGLLLGLLAAPALVGLVLGLRAPDPGGRLVAVLGLAAATAVAARVALLALVEVTSFPAVATGYLLPAFDPALVATALGTAMLAASLRRRWHTRTARADASVSLGSGG